MRQGHQNRRGRNRNNGGPRKGQNPVSRSYESNGPDMKIRGTPAHIAEKYIALSRDAQSNGDRVLSENYLQHAEHYNRIILAYRDQQAQQHSADQPSGGPNGGNGHHQRSRSQNDSQPGTDEQQPMDPAQAEQPAGNGAGQGQRRPARARNDRSADNRGRPPRGRKPRNAEAGDGGEEQGGVPEHEQPEFLRRSVRRPSKDGGGRETEAVAAADDGAQD